MNWHRTWRKLFVDYAIKTRIREEIFCNIIPCFPNMKRLCRIWHSLSQCKMAQTGVRATICAQFPFLASPSGNGTIFYSSIHLPGYPLLSPFSSSIDPLLTGAAARPLGQNTAFAAAKGTCHQIWWQVPFAAAKAVFCPSGRAAAPVKRGSMLLENGLKRG